jgi:hypothetical protein
MNNNYNDNPVQGEEIETEEDAEAGQIEKEPSNEANGENTDEYDLEVESVEERADTDQVMPAEIAAINTDNETATEATEALENDKE